MDKAVTTILRNIADKYGINPFIKRDILNELLLEQLDGKYERELKLLVRISNGGYIELLANAENIEYEKLRLIKRLHDNESIDETIVSEVMNLLYDIIISIKPPVPEDDIDSGNQLEILVFKMIKLYGIKILDKFDSCRAILKDMAQGEYPDEITLISLLLQKKIHKIIIRSRFFRLKKENLILRLAKKFAGENVNGVDVKAAIVILVNAIYESHNASNKYIEER